MRGSNFVRPSSLLPFIKHYFPVTWSKVFTAERDTFQSILGEPNLSASGITAGLSIKPKGAFRTRIDLSPAREFVQAHLAKHFDVDLLNCGGMGSVYEILSGSEDLSPSAYLTVYETKQLGDDPFALCQNEQRAIDHLANALLTSTSGLLSWSASHALGWSFLVRCLAQHGQTAEKYNRIMVIKTNDELPFHNQLMSLARDLQVPMGPDLFDLLLSTLRRERILLVLPGMDRVEAGQVSEFLKAFLVAARKVSKMAGANVLAVGKLDFWDKLNIKIRNKKIAKPDDVGDEVERVLAMDPAERFHFFSQQYARFCTERGVKPSVGLGGSRLKRADWHYRRIIERKVWPINLRLRAFFASNFDNHAYFDPTAGFLELAGAMPLPEDIALFHDDMVEQQPNEPRTLSALRLVSTTKHWLSQHMLLALTNAKKARSIETEMSKLAPSIQVRSRPLPRYVAGIGLKAVVQDEWRKDEPAERALVHWKVADQLWRLQDNKGRLAEEFPYQPHWGRSRIFFISECLRHLIRSCETNAIWECSEEITPSVISFPQSPRETGSTAYARHVVNFCFQVIYRQLLNDEAPDREIGASKLIRQHGASVAMELLQLMSAPCWSAQGVYTGIEFGRPHPALNKDLRVPFTRECGLAAWHVGDLRRSALCFEEMMASHDPLTNAEGALHLVRVRFDEDRIADAKSLLARAATLLDANSQNTSGRLQKLLQEQQGLFAHIDGKHQVAITHLGRQYTKGQLKDPELVHALARSVDAVPTPYRRAIGIPDALTVATRLAFEVLAEGLQQDGLGHKITLAKVLRKHSKLEASEAVLDIVHSGAVAYGCSEQVYLAFLLEAGRVMEELAKPIRAFSCYLLPCAERSHALGFNRIRNASVRFASRLLDTAEENLNNDVSKWLMRLETARTEDVAYRTMNAADEGEDSVDPLYGYAAIDGTLTIEMLGTHDGILRLRERLEICRDTPDDTGHRLHSRVA